MADPIVLDTNTPVEEVVDKTTQNAQDTQSAIGLLSPPSPSTISYTPPAVPKAVDASTYQNDSTTVAGQLSKLLSTDSEYMKQAAAKSKLTANELGMLSSDRYIGAAQGAAIREGLPIATADAASASKFAQQEQITDSTLATTSYEGAVSGALKAQDAQIQTQLKKTQASIDTLLASNTMKNNAELAGLNSKLNTASQEALKNLDFQLNTALMSNEYSQKTAEAARAQAASQIENSMITIENTLKNPDILQLGPEAMSKIINNEIALMRGGIELTYNLAKLNVDSYVSDLLDTFEATYQWTTA